MTSSNLKILACITMLIDHIGAVFYPEVFLLRMIGRIAFPIFAFLLVEGFIHTHNVKKYLTRLGLFAFISEVPFDLAFHNQWLYLNSQNVFFTLFLGLTLLIVYEKIQSIPFYVFLAVFGACLFATLIQADYYFFGILMIYCFYKYRNNIVKKLVFLSIIQIFMVSISTEFFTVISLFRVLQIFAIFSLLPIYLYNMKKGFQLKYLFYAFYPIHLFILFWIQS